MAGWLLTPDRDHGETRTHRFSSVLLSRASTWPRPSFALIVSDFSVLALSAIELKTAGEHFSCLREHRYWNLFLRFLWVGSPAWSDATPCAVFFNVLGALDCTLWCLLFDSSSALTSSVLKRLVEHQ